MYAARVVVVAVPEAGEVAVDSVATPAVALLVFYSIVSPIAELSIVISSPATAEPAVQVALAQYVASAAMVDQGERSMWAEPVAMVATAAMVAMAASVPAAVAGHL